MTDDPFDVLDDATLVAWIDGELPAAQADRVAAAVAGDRAWAERARLLRAARAEFAWALGESDTAPPPEPAVDAHRRPRAPWAPWLLAAAALVVVVVIATDGDRDAQATAAENDLLAVELSTPKAAWDLFTGIRVVLSGRAKTDVPVYLLSSNGDSDPESLAASARMVRANRGGAPVVPVAVTATIDDGRNSWQAPVAMLGALLDDGGDDVEIELTKMFHRTDGIGPVLTVRLGEDGAYEDFKWGLLNHVGPQLDGEVGFVPMEPANYRLTLRLRAIPFEAGAEPPFAEPLEVTTAFAVGGVVGAWSEPVDGMRARIVASRARRGDRGLAFALQLRNDSDRPRKFNVVGATSVEIPQPLHFDLVVDGERWRQRDDLDAVVPAGSSFLPLRVSTTRAVVALDDYWRAPDGASPARLRGRHRLALRFHFEALMVDSDDDRYWQGVIETPAITIDFGDDR